MNSKPSQPCKMLLHQNIFSPSKQNTITNQIINIKPLNICNLDSPAEHDSIHANRPHNIQSISTSNSLCTIYKYRGNLLRTQETDTYLYSTNQSAPCSHYQSTRNPDPVLWPDLYPLRICFKLAVLHRPTTSLYTSYKDLEQILNHKHYS
jgi:hypothetical protein